MLRWRRFFRKEKFERQLDSELSFHLEEQVREYVESGMDEQEARRRARLEFGALDPIKEDCRETRAGAFFETTLQDVRYAARALRKSPAFTIVAVLALAVGIGASSIIFTQWNAVFWHTLAVTQAEQLRTFSWTAANRKNPTSGLPYTTYIHLRDNTKTFSSLACTAAVRFSPLAEWGPMRPQLVSGNYFQALGVKAVVGRTITPDDDKPGAPALVAVVSYGVWQRAYGRAADVLNRTLAIRGATFQIVGVLPSGFAGMDPMDPKEVMLPYEARSALGALATGAATTCGGVVGRIQAGIPAAQAGAEADVLFQEAMLANPPKDLKSPRLLLSDLNQDRNVLRVREKASFSLNLLMATVSVIVLIVCANIAGLLLARGRARRKEIATRLAVGASRWRIVRQLLTESVLLSIFGGVIGVGLAYLATPMLPQLLTLLSGNFTLGGRNPTLGIDVGPDWRVVAFSAGVTILCGVLFGILPAFRLSRLNLIAAMKQASAIGYSDRFRFRTGKALIVAQVALSTVLLIGAGLMIRTFMNLSGTPVGYDPSKLFFVTIDPVGLPRTFIEDAVQRLHAVPGVTSVAVSVWPIYNNGGDADKRPICIPGFEVDQSVDTEYVFPRFFETWGVPFLGGRDFTGSPEPAVIVNDAFAKKFFIGKNPLGQTIAIGKCPGTPKTIVGLVANHADRQRSDMMPMVYTVYPSRGTEPTTLAFRVVESQASIIPAVRKLIEGLGTRIDGDVTPALEYKERTFKQERLLAALLVSFGAAALFISCLGIYGLLAYSVNRRISEIGIRMALGAERRAVIAMIVRESLIPVAAGIVSGVIAALISARFIEKVLFGVSKHDPWTIAAAAAVFLSSAAVAAYIPAKRASRIEPVRALRYE